jgi:hypothetical protein
MKKTKSKLKIPYWKCDVCDETFQTVEEIMEHMSYHYVKVEG